VNVLGAPLDWDLMEPADESVFAWIGGGGDILAGYSHEVRVLHTMVEDLSVKDHLVTWDQWEKETGERDKWLARLKRKGESGQILGSALAQSSRRRSSDLRADLAYFNH
jgi:hypothetical protein